MKWVVYLKSLYNKPAMKAVCDQVEWNAMESSQPGCQTLIKAGIASEGEAEAIARGPEEPTPSIWKARTLALRT